MMAMPISRMTVSDIAELAGVQRATVSNWQKRHDEFPKPLPDSPPRQPQFDAGAVRTWLAERYPEKSAGGDRATEAVRTWRYMMNDVACIDVSEELILLIAAIQGERITYKDDGGDERYPVEISADDVGQPVYATKPQADAIRQFLEKQLKGIDKAELLETAAQELDDLRRWRRSPEAVSAERNLHNLLAGLVRGESKKILDIDCGTGALLSATSRKHPNAKFFGVDPVPENAFVADARLHLRADVEIENLNILQDDALAGRTFDAVVSIPPFDLKVVVRRQLPFGPAQGSADAAWPQLAVQALASDGDAFLVLPHSLTSVARADSVRRELIQRGLVAAIVTLPPNALPGSKVLSDLWVLTRRRERTAEVLMVDYSWVDPDDEHAYETLRYELSKYLDDGGPPIISDDDDDDFHLRFVGADAPFVDVDPLELLGPTVILDPQYWCAWAATSTSAPELIGVVDQAKAKLARVRRVLTAMEVPDYPLLPAHPVMMTVRDARNDGLIEIIKRTDFSRKLRAASDDRIEPPTLRVADAEAMWRGEHLESELNAKIKNDPIRYNQLVHPGDVLVWLTSDRQIRSAVSTIDGHIPWSHITVLRCNSLLDADYLALAVATGANAIHATGSNIPMLRGLELSFPYIPLDQQRQLAHYARTARDVRKAALDVATAADELRQALADAAGSGSVGITVSEEADQ